jgi:hypothetical protein
VRLDRLKNHLKKVHHSQELNVDSDESVERAVKTSSSLTVEKFKQVANLINSWLRRKKDYLYNPNNVKILTIMALENFMGYSFDEINKLYGGRIQRDRYETGVKRLKATYEQMMDHLHKTLIRYSKHHIDQKTRNQYYSENDDSDGYADWYACNSVDRMDGSKYIGYHRREYEDSRFGSFPVHDDYSEESWADDNSWE